MAALQTWMRASSREQVPGGPKIPLTLDDAAFWIDWVVTAMVAMFLAQLGSSLKGDPISAPLVCVSSAVLFLGGGVFPWCVKQLCYDGTGRFKSWVHVAMADLVGLAILFACVVVGVKAYGA
ncbi:hypothetical protein ACH4SP_04015 [Streptomyces sp. NPDC021093]|uniref:hypothetical protein n=1 Tax=Streptomyces sp. NPDC021093 TaxID=3365112 RepID=UPI0037BB69D3